MHFDIIPLAHQTPSNTAPINWKAKIMHFSNGRPECYARTWLLKATHVLARLLLCTINRLQRKRHFYGWLKRYSRGGFMLKSLITNAKCFECSQIHKALSDKIVLSGESRHESECNRYSKILYCNESQSVAWNQPYYYRTRKGIESFNIKLPQKHSYQSEKTTLT